MATTWIYKTDTYLRDGASNEEFSDALQPGGYMAELSSDYTVAPEEEHTSVSDEVLPSVSKESISSVSEEVDTESTPSEEDKLTESAPNTMQGLPNLYSTTLRCSSQS